MRDGYRDALLILLLYIVACTIAPLLTVAFISMFLE